jgi:hypothetical protein
MKRTTQLRHENVYYSRIDSDVLQRNIARLDAAFKDSGKTVEAFRNTPDAPRSKALSTNQSVASLR